MRRAARWIVGGALVVALAASCTKTDSTSTTATTATSAPPTAAAGTASTSAKPSSGDETSGSAPASTAADKASFLAAGNAICKKMNATSAELSKQYQSGAKTPAAVQKLLDANGDLIEGSVADLKALPQPAGDEAQLSSMYDSVLALAALSHQMATATGQQDDAAVQKLQTEGKAKQPAVNKQFTDYGLTECGKGS